jgi:hypothetical protein
MVFAKVTKKRGARGARGRRTVGRDARQVSSLGRLRTLVVAESRGFKPRCGRKIFEGHIGSFMGCRKG